MIKEKQFKRQMIAVGKRLDEKNLLVGTGGNISIRLNDNEVLITASGLCKSMLRLQDITKVDMQGNILVGARPARDIKMHLSLYRTQPTARAIVHTHPPVITGFSITAYTFEQIALPEIIFELGGIAVTDYAIATTSDVPIVVEEAMNAKPQARAVVLANHGALTFSERNVMDACFKMELLEMVAKSTLISNLIGNVRTLTTQQVDEIVRLIKNLL